MAEPQRAAKAMESLERQLIRHDDGVAILFWPPFDTTPHDPGYIKGYPPGLRENGGQYSHAAMWAVYAFAKLGAGDKAASLFSLLNPINHANTPEKMARYKVEPYVVAADVYSVAPHIGRGGWTWYTGSAAWMYRAVLEGILGIRREGEFVVVNPCLPALWTGFEASVIVGMTHYEIYVTTQSDCDGLNEQVALDDVTIPAEHPLRFPLDGKKHKLEISYLNHCGESISI